MSSLVLIADDDRDIRQIVKNVVSGPGISILEASSGKEVLQMTETIDPDLYILDVMMPGIDGIEVCERLKAREKNSPHVPVLMLTALEDIENKVRALESGADDYLIKPFHVEELQARVRALLRVKELTERLQEKNIELQSIQEKLLKQEREMVVLELAGAAAHELGQPLSAILLNCHLLETLSEKDLRVPQIITSIRKDSQRMAEILEKLRNANPNKKSEYYKGSQILDLNDRKD